MRRTRFNRSPCPIARTTDLLGDWWTPLILREAWRGARRFGEFHEALGLSRAVLTQRLNRLVDEDLFERRPYQEKPRRYEYVLTPKGRDLLDLLAAMWGFGSDRLWGERGPAVELFDPETGETVEPALCDRRTGRPLVAAKLRMRRRARPPAT